MTRTIGAAIGALIMLLFMAHMGARLTTPVAASSHAESAAR